MDLIYDIILCFVSGIIGIILSSIYPPIVFWLRSVSYRFRRVQYDATIKMSLRTTPDSLLDSEDQEEYAAERLKEVCKTAFRDINVINEHFEKDGNSYSIRTLVDSPELIFQIDCRSTRVRLNDLKDIVLNFDNVLRKLTLVLDDVTRETGSITLTTDNPGWLKSLLPFNGVSSVDNEKFSLYDDSIIMVTDLSSKDLDLFCKVVRKLMAHRHLG